MLAITRSATNFLALAVLAMTFLASPRAVAQNACVDSVQGRIAWAGSKEPAWTPTGDRDGDGDGFINVRVCNGRNCGDDCDDTRPAVNPHAAELPNRRDDNCNGAVDDDLEGWWNPAR